MVAKVLSVLVHSLAEGKQGTLTPDPDLSSRKAKKSVFQVQKLRPTSRTVCRVTNMDQLRWLALSHNQLRIICKTVFCHLARLYKSRKIVRKFSPTRL